METSESLSTLSGQERTQRAFSSPLPTLKQEKMHLCAISQPSLPCKQRLMKSLHLHWG